MPTDRDRFRHALAVAVVGGLLVGYVIGYVPVAVTLHGYLGNCTRYTGEDACTHETDLCRWRPAFDRPGHFYCAFKNGPNETRAIPAGCASVRLGVNDTRLDEICDAARECHWDAGSKMCEHAPEWVPWQVGLYAAMMVVGAVIASSGAAPLLDRFGRRTGLALTGVISAMGVALLTAGWQANTDPHTVGSYGLMLTGRLIVGVALGLAIVACPVYFREAVPTSDRARTMVGCAFQVATNFGTFLVALIGYLIVVDVAADPQVQAEFKHLQDRFEVVNVVHLAIALALLPTAWWVAEPDRAKGDQDGRVNPSPEVSPLLPSDEPEKKPSASPYRRLKLHLAVAFVLAIVQQFTGMNAVMNYVPDIAANFGLHPLQGNMYVMLWNVVTTVFAIPLSRRFSPAKMYLSSAVVASVACLLTAIPVFPAVSPAGSTAGYAVTGAGVLLFVAAFQLGIGPAFWVLVPSLFPPEDASMGTGFTVTVQFVFGLAINFSFPVAVAGVSGGSTGDQRLGVACVFAFFGVIGLISTAILAAGIRAIRHQQQRQRQRDSEQCEHVEE